MARIDQLVEQYLRHLTIERGMSKNTVLAYRRDLNGYLQFLESVGVESVSQVTQNQIKDFAQYLVTNKGLVSTSVARVLAGVRGFHKFLLLENLVELDVAASVKPPKLPRRLPKAIPFEDI
ncbi:MAG: site-specific tyrosine recombinase XerD, partial [Microbacteriaceae bacterium]|nr:site-specific tyrosine recombinase XerD [Microbacteriaceae bacterium]